MDPQVKKWYVIYFQFWLCESRISPLILEVFEKKSDSAWLHGLFLFGLQPITEAVVLLLQTRDNKRQSKRQKSYFLKGYDLTLHNITDLFRSLRSDSICFCLLWQWVLNVPTSSCCSFSQSVNSECCWGGTCWPPLCSWSFSWSRRLSASLDFKKAWWTWEKLWGAVHHPSTRSIYLSTHRPVHQLTASLCRYIPTSVLLSGFSKHSLTDSWRSWNHPSKDCLPSGEKEKILPSCVITKHINRI